MITNTFRVRKPAHDHEEDASRNRFRLIPELTILLANAYPEEVQTVIDVACFGVYNSHRAFQCKFLEAHCAYYPASKLASPGSQTPSLRISSPL